MTYKTNFINIGVSYVYKLFSTRLTRTNMSLILRARSRVLFVSDESEEINMRDSLIDTDQNTLFSRHFVVNSRFKNLKSFNDFASIIVSRDIYFTLARCAAVKEGREG